MWAHASTKVSEEKLTGEEIIGRRELGSMLSAGFLWGESRVWGRGIGSNGFVHWLPNISMGLGWLAHQRKSFGEGRCRLGEEWISILGTCMPFNCTYRVLERYSVSLFNIFYHVASLFKKTSIPSHFS